MCTRIVPAQEERKERQFTLPLATKCVPAAVLLWVWSKGILGA
jgi:hypothetical protein